MSDICFHSAVKIAEAIRSKAISARELVEIHLSRIAATSASINAVVRLAEERAMEEARKADEMTAGGNSLGALHGVPITIKDSLDCAGIISTGGTTGRVHFVPETDATVVSKLRQAGAIVLGKTNTPELTMSGETDNLIYGRTNNPFDIACSTGGSSGGSAANLAVGGAALDVGSDTGGSIREPAHYCGVAGLKPSAGRISRSGHIVPYGMGAVDALTHLGPMARSVGDLALALPIMCGPDWKDPSVVPMTLGRLEDVIVGDLRVACYTDDGVTSLAPEIAAAVERTATSLSKEGIDISWTRPDGLEEAARIVSRLRQADGGAMRQRLLARMGTPAPGPHLTDCFLESTALNGEDYSRVLEEADQARSRMLGFFRHYDAILCPVSFRLAPPHGSTKNDTFLMWSYSMVYNLTGWPSTAVPVGRSESGLPIGVQVVAAPWREDISLALGARIEKLTDGFVPPPLVHNNEPTNDPHR